MKKIIALILAISCILTFTPFPGGFTEIMVSALGASDTGVVTLLEEDFESGNIGDDVYNFNGWTGRNALEINTSSVFRIKAESESNSNKVASLYRTQNNGNLYYVWKPFSEAVTEGVVNIKFRLQKAHENSKIFLMHVLKETTGVVIGSLNIDLTSFAVGTWVDAEYSINVAAKAYTRTLKYKNSEDEDVTETVSGTISDSKISAVTLSTNRTAGTTGEEGEFFVDDLYVKKLPALKMSSVKATETDNTKEVIISFNNEIVSDVLKENLTVTEKVTEGTPAAEAIKSIAPYNASKKEFLVEFENPLKYAKDYEFSFSGLVDEYGNAPETVKGSYTTRAARTDIKVAFYEDYVDTDNKTSIDEIQIGENTAEVIVTNETESPVRGIIAMVHKSVEGTLKDATAIPLSVDGKDNGSFDVSLTLAGKENDDRIEVFVLDDEYNPISGVTTLSSGGPAISSYKKSTATSITVDANIIEARDDGATMKVTGQVTPEEECDALVIVLKPGKTITELDDSTFKSCVDYIGQTIAGENGKYELSYDFINESTTDVVYNLYAYSYGAQVSEKSVKFFSKAFMDGTLLPTVQNADKEGFMALLDKDAPTPVGSENLSAILGIDLTDYHNLQAENKDKVCDYLANDSFGELPEIIASSDIENKSAITNVDDIKPIINAVIQHQKNKETSERALLESIDAADWEEMQGILTAEENKDVLELPWTGSYAVIKDDATAVENLFKALADDNKYSFISGTNAAGFAALRAAFEAEAAAQIGNISVFYVSPSGNDANPGTKAAPWKSLHKAAQSLQAGQTAIFENGTYVETEYTEFANAGSEGSPITIKSENKHGAVIKYVANLRLQKLRVHKSYIHVKDFVITQEEKSTASSQRPTLDILVECGYGKYQPLEGCVIEGNKFYNVYEEGIKVKYTRNAIIRDNIIEEPNHEGIDCFANDAATISGNTIISPGRVGVMVKGNSRNCLVYNNEVRVISSNCTAAFTIGGQSDSTSPYDVAMGTGFEAYNCVFLNNIAYTKEGVTLNVGYSFSGAFNCYAFNNISSGAVTGFSFGSAPDERNGWGWDPPTVNPTLYNNIVVNATNGYTGTNADAFTYTSSHNLFYNVTSNVVDETGIVKSNPEFINPAEGDFRLGGGSSARKAGITLPTSVAGYAGISGIDTIDSDKTISIAAVDFDGVSRLTPYDMGAYNRSAADPAELLEETFENAAAGDSIHGYNSWKMYGNGTNSTNDTKIITKYEDENAAVKNKVASISRTRTPQSSDSVNMWGYKLFSAPQNSGIISLRFKLKPMDVDAKTLRIILVGSEGHSVSTDFISIGLTGLTEGTTYLYDLSVSLDSGDIVVYRDGNYERTTSTPSFKNKNVYGVGFGSPRNDSSIVPNCEIYIDDIFAYKIDDLNITSIVPTGDDNVTEAIVKFNNDVEETSIDCTKITVRGIGGEGINDLATVTSAVPYGGKQSEYKLTFANPLKFSTIYSISFDGITDKYGNAPENGKVLCNYETRDARLEIGEVNFYKNYSGTKNEITSLQNGEITAEIIVTNEKTASVDAFMIMAYKSQKGTVKDITAQKVSVSQGQKDIKFTTSLDISSKEAGDSVELFLIDNLSSYQPIKGAIVLSSEVTQKTLKKNNLTGATVDATVTNATNTGATLKVEGMVLPEGEGDVILLVMKPGKTISNLTSASDFKSCVDFIGQETSNTEGEYDLSYDLKCSTDNTLYNLYVSAYGATQLANGSVKFFTKNFMDGILTAVKGAGKADLLNMLKKVSPTLFGGYDSLAGILGIDLTDYHKLQEPEKVCDNLITRKNELVTVDDIKPLLSELILAQKNKEASDAALLKSIDNAEWGTLQDILTSQDNQSTLSLPWTGSYDSIKNNSTAVENLYKALARDYTFVSATNKEGFTKLRTAFEEEAKKLIDPNGDSTDIGNGGNSDLGGGGGGGSISVGKDLDLVTPPTPINEDELTEKTPVFTDLSDYSWAAEAINSLCADKIVNGTGNDKFEPERLVRREEFVKMIVLAFNLLDEKAVATGFTDVKATDWFMPYVASAVKCGIINGVDSSHFGVEQQLTRAEMATILYRVATIKGISLKNGEGLAFTDNSDIPNYAKESVKALTEAGILNGMGNGKFEPYSKTNRAMAAKVVYTLRKER